MKLVLHVLVFSILLTHSLLCNAKDTVSWRVTDWPPFYILDGENKGTGLYDKMIAMLSAGMPEYTHETIQMNTLRWTHEMEMGTKICHPSVLPNTKAVLSVANSILLPHRLIVHHESVDIKEFDQPVSLKKLLTNNKYRGGVTLRYTAELNDIVEKHLLNKHLHNSPNYKNLISLVLQGKLDYIIEYDPIISYSAKQQKIENSTINLEIFETCNRPFVMVHVACPNTDWGKTIISKVNKILISESKKPEFLDFRIHWYDKNTQKLLESYYKDHYFFDK